MIQKFLNLFRKTPNTEPIESFTFPTGNSKINFSKNWLIVKPKKGDSTFTFFNEEIDGILYASILTQGDSEYVYDRNNSIETYKNHSPELIGLSKYGAVLCQKADKTSNVTYKHYDIGFEKTLLQFTWMTPYPDDERINQEIETILGSAKIE
jgi:hypothetical protein